jgi:hypothetical protein
MDFQQVLQMVGWRILASLSAVKAWHMTQRCGRIMLKVADRIF